MTLVIAAHVGGKFCITTADTRTTYFSGRTFLDGTTYNTSDEPVDSDDKSEKVIFLTDKVMFTGAGQKNLIEYVRNKLLKKVEQSDCLITAMTYLDEIIVEIRERNKKAKTDFMEDDLFFLQSLDTEDSFGVLLNGFDEFGGCGFAYYIAGYDEEVLYQESPEGEYSYAMWAPTGDYSEKKDHFFDIPVTGDKEGFDMLFNQMVKVHAVVSHLEPVVVSPVCKYKVLKYKPKKDKFIKKIGEIDTSELYEEMQLIEEK